MVINLYHKLYFMLQRLHFVHIRYKTTVCMRQKEGLVFIDQTLFIKIYYLISI